MERRQLVAVEEFLRPGMIDVVEARPPPARPDLVAGRLQDRLVGGVLPLHELLDDPKQPLTLLVGEDVVEGRERTGFRDLQAGALRLMDEVGRCLPELHPRLERGLGPASELRVVPQDVHVLRRVVHHL